MHRVNNRNNNARFIATALQGQWVITAWITPLLLEDMKGLMRTYSWRYNRIVRKGNFFSLHDKGIDYVQTPYTVLTQPIIPYRLSIIIL